jgi:hypothetical protein
MVIDQAERLREGPIRPDKTRFPSKPFKDLDSGAVLLGLN